MEKTRQLKTQINEESLLIVFPCSDVAYLGGAAEMVIVNLLYCLEVDDSLQFGLVFVCKGEGERKEKKIQEGLLTIQGLSWLQKLNLVGM